MKRAGVVVAVWLAMAAFFVVPDSSWMVSVEAQPAGWTNTTVVKASTLQEQAIASGGPGRAMIITGNSSSGNTETYATTDGGVTWSKTADTTSTVDRFVSISCVDNNTCYVGYEAGGGATNTKFTKDHGASWGSPPNQPIDCAGSSGNVQIPHVAARNLTTGYDAFYCSYRTTVTDRVAVSTDTQKQEIDVDASFDTLPHVSFGNDTVVWASYDDDSSFTKLARLGSNNTAQSIVTLADDACDVNAVYGISGTRAAVLFENVSGEVTVEVWETDTDGSNPTHIASKDVSVATPGTCDFWTGSDGIDQNQFAFVYSYRDPDGRGHVEIAYTLDGGLSWTTERIYSRDTSAAFELRGSVAIDSDGTAYVSVIDRTTIGDESIYVYTRTLFDPDAGACGDEASACYLDNDRPFNVVTTDYTGDWVYARETGNGDIFANGRGSVFRFGAGLSLANTFYPCLDLDGGNFRYNEESSSLVTTHDNFVLAACTITNLEPAGDNKDTSLHAMNPDLSRATEFCSPTLPVCNTSPWGDMEVQLETLATTWDFTSMWENDIGLVETDKVYRGKGRDGPSATFEAPGSLYDVTMDRGPDTEHHFWVTGSFGTRGFDKSHNVVFRQDSLTARAVGVYDGSVYLLNAGNLSRYAFVPGSLTLEASNTTGPWTTEHTGNMKMSKDGDFLAVWTDDTISVVNLTDDNLNVTQTFSRPASAAFNDVEWTFGNDYLITATDDGVYRFDVFDVTTWFGEDGGPGQTNPIGGTEDLFDGTGTARETEAEFGADDPADQFLGVDLSSSEDVGVDAGQFAWFLGILMIIGIGGAVFAATGSGAFAAIGAFAGLGFGLAMNLIPTWFMVALVFFGVVLIVYRFRMR